MTQMHRSDGKAAVSPPAPNPNSTQPSFRTFNIAFAAALNTAHLLAYRGTELVDDGRRAVFVFEDPSSEGPELLRRYESGDFPLVNPKYLFAARGYLTDQVARLKGVGRYERS